MEQPFVMSFKNAKLKWKIDLSNHFLYILIQYIIRTFENLVGSDYKKAIGTDTTFQYITLVVFGVWNPCQI